MAAVADSHEAALRRALRLALKGRYRVSPNPIVGAVVVRSGEVVGEGYHRLLGGPHAEVEALRQAGAAARGATLYVTLEPCCHYGRTPPCVGAILAAGLNRVVACHADPNPQVRGRGFAELRSAGVEVESGPLAEEAARQNLRYLVPHVLGRPLVTLKWAMSLDGKIATAKGESQWISSPPARRWALELRELHDAILVGSGTALADDPRLNRRLHRAPGPIVRVILDRRLRLRCDARLFSEDGPVLVYTEREDPDAAGELEAKGATVVVLSGVRPTAVVADLFDRGIRSVLVEGGGEVLSAFVDEAVYDRVAVCVAPKLVGGSAAPGPLGGKGIERLASAPEVEGVRVRRRSVDVILTGLRRGCLPELLESLVE